MTVSGPAAVATRSVGGLVKFRSLRSHRSHLGSSGCGSFCCHSVLPQMASGQVYENVFETSLARAEVFKLVPVARHRSQQSGDGEVRLADPQADRRILPTDRLYARQRLPAVKVVGSAISVLTHLELDNLIAAKAVDELRRSGLGDDLGMIDNCDAVRPG